MNTTQLQAIKDHFYSYSDGYISRSGPMVKLMEMKREHCAGVAANCRALAEAMDWPESEANTAEALGYLHDVGRFPQLAEYATFDDAKSINHGKRGHQAILESGLLGELDHELKECILCGVLHHNAKLLPNNLPESHYPLLKLIRDADRLDIYRIVYDALVTKTFMEHPEIVLHVSIEGDPNPSILETMEKREPVSHANIKCLADFLLMQISWTYLMSYPATLGIMRERRTIERLSEFLPLNLPAVGKAVSNIRKYIDESAA